MVLGVTLAVFIVFFNKKTLGKLVKKLFEEKAENEITAKSLKELGLEKSRILRYALREGSTLRKMVYAVPPRDGEEAASGEKGQKSGEVKYYIPEDKAYRAELTYNPDGTSVLTVVLAILIFAIVSLVLLAVIPSLVRIAVSTFSSD